MIPKGNSYKTTTVSRVKNKANVESFLNKFGIRDIFWRESDPQDSYFIFQKKDEFGNNIAYKVNIPFVEKKNKKTRETTFHEERSYAYLWHILKALMNMTDLEMSIEEVFMPYMVVDKTPDGEYLTLRDKTHEQRLQNKIPSIEGPR